MCMQAYGRVAGACVDAHMLFKVSEKGEVLAQGFCVWPVHGFMQMPALRHNIVFEATHASPEPVQDMQQCMTRIHSTVVLHVCCYPTG